MSEPPPFGTELRRRRVAAGLSLGALAKRVHYSKGHLSKVESGQKPASTELARLCDAELGADGKLIDLLPAARSGSDGAAPSDVSDPHDDETWVVGVGNRGGYFAPVNGGDPRAGTTTTALSMTFNSRVRAAAETALGLFLVRFHEARRLGQVAGAGAVLPLVIMETKALQTLADHAPPEEQVALFQLAARYAEFAGWIAQEAGDDRMAWWLTEKAVRMASAAGDPSLRTYALVRRADIALHQDDALSTIEMASRAQQHSGISARVGGLAAQREAQGHALAGNQNACLHALERSAVLLAEAAAGPQDGPVLGTAHTPDLAALIRGWCLHELGRPAQAAEILDRGIVRFPPGAHRARVRYEARAALAYATAGELERACELLGALLDIAAILDSATIRHDLRSLNRVLVRWRSHPTVRDLLPALVAVLQIHPRLAAATPAANLLLTPSAE
ncbi:MAG: helix-turn-helix domain-containing protein [Pseudonocardiaceae bacterium]